MKKVITLSLLVLPGFFAKAICRIDTVLNFEYPVGSSVKEIESRLINTYDISNKVIQEIAQYWDNATLTFVNDYKYSYVYDANGNNIEELLQNWDDVSNTWVNGHKKNRYYNAAGKDTLTLDYSWLLSGSWQNSFSQSKTFDAAGNAIGGMSQTWNVSASAWQNYLRQTNTFDAANNQITGVSEQWNTTTSTWESLSNVTNSYDVSKHIIKRINQSWDGTTVAWRNTWLYYYSYNAAGKLAEFNSQGWDMTISNWVEKTKQFYRYNSLAYLVKDSIVKMSVFGTWVNSEQKTFVYNAANLLTERKVEEWHSASAAWRNYEMHTNEYNASNDLIAYDQYREWNSTATSYDKHTRTENKCTDIPTAIREPLAQSALNIYPNPVTTNQLFIDTKAGQTYSLFDMRGQNLKRGNLQKGINIIEVADLSSGLYFIKTSNEVKRIIIQ